MSNSSHNTDASRRTPEAQPSQPKQLRLAGILCLLLAIPLHSQEPDPYVRAQHAFTAKDFETSATLFAEAARLRTPPHPDALLLQSNSLVNLDQFADADPVLRAYIDANPSSADALYLLGYVLQRENKPKDSLSVFTRAAAIRPPQPNDLKLVALNYVLLNDYPDAAHWLNRCLAADPSNQEAWYSLGRVHMEQGDFVEAERNLRRALTLNPQDPKSLNNLGLSLEAQNRSDEALAAYREAVAAQLHAPHPSEQPLLNLGALLNAKARSAEAIDPLRSAVAVTPKCARCHEELARALLATHLDDAAIREMEQAVLLDPKNPRFHYQLGQMYRHTGLPAKADAELKISASLYGSHSTPTDR